MILKYTDKRAARLRKVMKQIPVRHKAKRIIFDGARNFKFIFKNRTIEVSYYDEEIVIRPLR